MEGYIPGENETEANFAKRIQAQKCFTESCLKNSSDALTPQKVEELIDDQLDRFDLSPGAAAAIFNSRRIPFWQAALTISGPRKLVEKELQPIFPNLALSSETKIVSYLQFSRKIQKGKMWKIYSLKEILAHELIHAARAPFQGTKYEEILAYQTSSSPWRKFLGPLFEKPWESYFLMATLCLSLISSTFGEFFFLSQLLIACFATFLLLRLIHRQFRFNRCMKKLKPFCSVPEKILAVMVRLTDSEISLFSRLPSEDVAQKIKEKQDSFRWKQIAEKYLKPTSFA